MAAGGSTRLMGFVLDASIAASWAFPDETDSIATLALTRLRTGSAHVPSLWWSEICNTLIIGERRNRIAATDTVAFLHDLMPLDIAPDRAPDGARVLHLARLHRLTVYDAAYLELAERLALPLATLDTALRRSAVEAGVALLDT